jgi:hypothetical protein
MRYLITFLLILSGCAAKKATTNSSASVVTPVPSPVVPLPSLLANAKVFLDAGKFVNGMTFSNGAYSMSAVPTDVPTVLSDSSGSYFKFDRNSELALGSSIVPILNGNSFSIVETIDFSENITNNLSNFQALNNWFVLFNSDDNNLDCNITSWIAFQVPDYSNYQLICSLSGKMPSGVNYLWSFHTPYDANGSHGFPYIELQNKSVIVFTFDNMNDFSSSSIVHGKVYINGVLQTITLEGMVMFGNGGGVSVNSFPEGPPKLVANQNLNIGYRSKVLSNTDYRLYNFTLYDRALSADEVVTIYNLLK